jgi:hypothetical protein
LVANEKGQARKKRNDEFRSLAAGNSARMFAGAGQGPMLAAAAAWDGVAEELGAAAGSFATVTSELAGAD